jgi:hypothetical protein
MEPVERKAMQVVVHRLHQRLPDVPVSCLEEEVGAAYAEYHGSRVRDFVWILVERQVLEREREAPARGAHRALAGPAPAHRS